MAGGRVMQDRCSGMMDLIADLEMRVMELETEMHRRAPYHNFGQAQRDWSKKAKETHDAIQSADDQAGHDSGDA